MKDHSPTVLLFPAASGSSLRAERKELLGALRCSGSPVIIDFSNCSTLNHEDIGLLLEGLDQAAGRDTKMLLVAGTPANRVMLDVTRISTLAPVFSSVVEALAYADIPAGNDAEPIRAPLSQTSGRA